MKKYLFTFTFTLLAIAGFSQETLYTTEVNIPYYPESIRQSDDYISERCVLDIYYPTNMKDFATIV